MDIEDTHIPINGNRPIYPPHVERRILCDRRFSRTCFPAISLQKIRKSPRLLTMAFTQEEEYNEINTVDIHRADRRSNSTRYLFDRVGMDLQ